MCTLLYLKLIQVVHNTFLVSALQTTLYLCYNDQEFITVSCEHDVKLTNTLCGQSAVFLVSNKCTL